MGIAMATWALRDVWLTRDMLAAVDNDIIEETEHVEL